MNPKKCVVPAIVVMIVVSLTPTVAAQSVSGLSEKPDSTATARTVAAMEDLLELVRAIDAAQSPQEREKLVAQLTGLRTGQTRDGINIAVPAGATASVGKNSEGAAGPLLGFQAWKSDDFFAGAFFTFDVAQTLNGDAVKAGEFLRNPPAAGTSLFVSGSRMFWGLTQWRPYLIRKEANLGRTPSVFAGLSVRAGATSVTLQHKVSEEETDSRNAVVIHATPSLLVTSRTFTDGNGGEYQFGLEAGWTYRRIGGDASLDKGFLAHTDVLGHQRRNFHGWDVTFFTRLNEFQPFVRVTRIARKDDVHVRGLTGVQATFGVNVQSALFQTVKGK